MRPAAELPPHGNHPLMRAGKASGNGFRTVLTDGVEALWAFPMVPLLYREEQAGFRTEGARMCKGKKDGQRGRVSGEG